MMFKKVFEEGKHFVRRHFGKKEQHVTVVIKDEVTETLQDAVDEEIDAYAKAQEEKTRLEEIEKQKILDHIASYADRIKDMLLIANTLYKNDISVSRFEASRKKHTFGFIFDKDDDYPICYFAIGVLEQVYDCWRLASNIDYNPDNPIRYPKHHGDVIIDEKGIALKFDTIWDCESWTKDFEEFEERFYNYVDNEIQ